MARVTWSKAAEYDLVNTVRVPSVIAELTANAEVTLHDVKTVGPNEGVMVGGKAKTMWHRGFTHEQEREINAGTLPEQKGRGPQVWDYFLFYRQRGGAWLAGFEVLSVRSNRQVASRYLEMIGYRLPPASPRPLSPPP